MNIFIIGSDKTLVGQKGIGDAPFRHAKYGEYVNHIDILIYTNNREGRKNFPISSNVLGLPSNSLAKPFLFFDALKIFRQVNRNRHIDLIIVQDPFFFGLVGYWLKKRSGAKLIVNFHGDFWGNKFWLKERFLNRLFLPLSYFVVSKADAIRCVSQAIKSKLIKRGVSDRKIEVIPTSIDLDKFKFKDFEKVEQIKAKFLNKKLIVFVGRFHPIKNIPFLIKGFSIVKKELPDTELLLIGDGSEKQKIMSLVNQLGLKDSVFFAGELPHKDIIDYYYASHVLVLPSFSEGLPKVLTEGGLCGLPLIAPEAPWSGEIIKDGENGYLVPIDDAEALADRLVYLLKNDILRDEMSEKSRILAEKRVSRGVEKLTEFWQKVVNESR